MQGFGRYCWVAEGFCHNLLICLGKTYQHEVLIVTFHKKMVGAVYRLQCQVKNVLNRVRSVVCAGHK